MPEIFIAPSSFGCHSNQSIKLLEEQDFIYTKNLKNRKLSANEILELAYEADGIIAGTEIYSNDVINNLPKLKVISRLGVGLDNINFQIADKKRIKVYNTNSPAPAVAELILGLILDLARQISYHNNYLKKGKWDKNMGTLLGGKTLGIIGLGSVGKAFIELVQGFKLKILAYDLVEDDTLKKKYNVEYCDLDRLLKNSNFVSINLNLTSLTKNMINKTRLDLMRSDSILVNTSRAEIVDENALYYALKNKKLGGAGIDVFKEEPYSGKLIELENTILTPHIGSYAKEIRIKMEIEATQNLIKGLSVGTK